MIRRFLALILYGNPLAADPVWREADRAEQLARRRHQATRPHQKAKAARIRAALEAAVHHQPNLGRR